MPLLFVRTSPRIFAALGVHLRTFALIVSAHPYCARNSHATSCIVQSKQHPQFVKFQVSKQAPWVVGSSEFYHDISVSTRFERVLVSCNEENDKADETTAKLAGIAFKWPQTARKKAHPKEWK